MTMPVIAVFALLLMCVGAADADDRVRREPYEIVHALQEIQDRVARNENAEEQAQGALLREFSETAASVPPKGWERARNRDAFVWFLLAGGRAKPMARHIEAVGMSPEERRLINGAIAAADGRDSDAFQLLRNVDAKSLPPGLGGIVALTQARLAPKADISATMNYLDTARLLAPGALVEEAALRQQIVLMSDAGNRERFVALSRRYFAKFARSAFATPFGHRFKAAFARMWRASDEAARLDLEPVLGSLPAEERAQLFLTVARDAILSGDLEAAGTAARRVRVDYSEGSPAANQAEVYKSAAGVFGGESAQSVADLRSLTASALPPAERALRSAALALAERIRAGASSSDAVADQTYTPQMREIAGQLARADKMIRGQPE
jgi:chemotaxis protein MotC